MHISKGLSQSYQAQDFCFEALMALKAALSQSGSLKVAREDALSIKALVSAWESAQMRVAFHRRVPAVKAVDPPKSEGKRRRSSLRGPVSVWSDPTVSPDAPVQDGNGNGHGTT